VKYTGKKKKGVTETTDPSRVNQNDLAKANQTKSNETAIRENTAICEVLLLTDTTRGSK
jgi:hypothetical protein